MFYFPFSIFIVKAREEIYLNSVDDLYATAGIDFGNIAGMNPAFAVHSFSSVLLILDKLPSIGLPEKDWRKIPL